MTSDRTEWRGPAEVAAVGSESNIATLTYIQFRITKSFFSINT